MRCQLLLHKKLTSAAELAVEELAAKFHEVYQVEAKRQGDIRHHDSYEQLPKNVKEFDRALARYVIAFISAREQALRTTIIAECSAAFQNEYSRHDSPLIGVSRGLKAIAALDGKP